MEVDCLLNNLSMGLLTPLFPPHIIRIRDIHDNIFPSLGFNPENSSRKGK